MSLEWNTPASLTDVKDREVIMIQHNRGTWSFPEDPERINCVVVYRSGDRFKDFGPDCFNISEIAAWARFNHPGKLERAEKLQRLAELLYEADALQQEVVEDGALCYQLHTQLTNLAEGFEEMLND